MKKSFLTFLLKCIIIISPFLILFVYYYLEDPFMVIHKYRNYDKSILVLNSNVVGWNTYLNHKDSLKYDSFIFGNSCTMAFKCSDWGKYLDANDHAIRLYCESENISAIYYKLNALDEGGANIKNVLLVVDNSIFEQAAIQYGARRILTPEISNISNFEFQSTFIQAFFTPKYFVKYIDYKIFHKYRRGMSGIINPYKNTIDSVNCDFYSPLELEIEKKKEKYWTEDEGRFKITRETDIEQPEVINVREKSILEDIKVICQKHDTNIKVIITPNFYRQRFNTNDRTIIESIFGRSNVFDFSQIPEYSDKHYFYEKTHFRPILGELMLKQVYNNPIQSSN